MALQGACEENSRWERLPWVYLTYAERNAWGILGWSEKWWNIAWKANAAAVSASGRCFGTYFIGESGEDQCFSGSVNVQTYDDCANASAAYIKAYPDDLPLLPLGKPVDDPQGTPACSIQDRVGFQFNQAFITGANPGYSPVCKFNSTTGCPTAGTSTAAPDYPPGLNLSNTVPKAIITCYQDLSRDQQDAVRFLGYNISSWAACMNPSWNPPVCTWPPGIPMPDAPCLERMDYLSNKYNISRPWAELSYMSKQALVDLGWDSAGTMWAAQALPETYAKPFSGQPPPQGLTRQQREAAQFLGYTQDVWAGCQPETECIIRFDRLERKMRTWTWGSTMPAGIRARLQQLDWTEDSWFEGEQPAVYRNTWAQLMFPQRVAARLVGYTQDMWDGCPKTGCVVRYNYIIAKYAGVAWRDMNLAQQDAWILLGHSEALWDDSNGGMMKTPLMSKRWAELTPEQRRQAKFLGWDEGTWQGCNLQWGSGDTVNSTTAPPGSGGPYRTVRVRMTIQRPFSEVSGNVYGQQVSTLPTSFVDVFERSVGRALFCGNPDYKNYTAGAVDSAGKPLCKLPNNFEKEKGRIQVLAVREGSIIVDFLLIRNQTADEVSAVDLYGALMRQLTSTASPICQDVEFGRFARAAKIEEVSLSDLTPEEMQQALQFEKMRAQYDDTNACNLQSDARAGAVRCPVAGASGRGGSLHLGALLLALALLATPGQPVSSRAC